MTYQNQPFTTQQPFQTGAPQQQYVPQQNNAQEREFGWDDTIVNDGQEFILLPAGEYDFVVEKFERGRSKGTGSLPPSNMAIVTLKIEGQEGTVHLKEHLILHTKMEWKLSQFFSAIGQKKKGEPLKMNWNTVIGAKGRVKLKIEDYISNKGDTLQSNKVDKYIMPPGYDAQNQNGNQPPYQQPGGYTPGAF